MKKAIFLALLPLSFVSSSTFAQNAHKSVYQQLSEATDAAPAPQAIAKSGWDYSGSEDKMRGTKTFLAILESSNSIDYGFPYGNKSAEIVVRNSSDGLEIYFSVNSIIDCGYGGCNVSLKFDDGKIESWPGQRSTDLKGLFVSAPKKFLPKLASSKHLIIEIPIYQRSGSQYEFDLQGLDVGKLGLAK